MIKVGIIGATGYAGAEIARLIYGHPQAEVVWYGSRSYIDEYFSSVYGNFFKLVDAKCLDDNMEELAEQVDVIFTATPQGLCAGLVNDEILNKVKIIDLSADFRLKDVAVYEKWYGIEHKAPQYINEAVYGLCEINRESIKGKRLVANPGCYTTCSILTAYPLVKEKLIDPNTLIVDALSGVSGAGRGAKTANLYCEVNESTKPYGVATHRHTPEIEEQLGYAVYSIVEGDAEYSNTAVSDLFEEKNQPGGYPITINFTPHLVPMNRGILATCYASLMPGYKAADVAEAFKTEYENEYFIRLLGEGKFPETRWVEGSNFVDIGFTVDERTGRVIVCGALDNVVKGAAGQAVQNMNLLFGVEETEGLTMPPLFP